MIRLVKWCVLPAVLLGGFLLASPKAANAGDFSLHIGGGYPSFYSSRGYYGPGWHYGGSPYRSRSYGHGHGFGGHRGGYGGYGIYGGYGGHGGHHHHHRAPGCYW